MAASLRAPPFPASRDALATGSAESRLLTAALALFVVLVLALSPFALTALGFDYSETGGNALTKFHPATLYILSLALLAALATSDPFGAILRALHEAPVALLMLLAILLGTLHSAFISRLPVTPLIETFLPAGVTLLLLRRISEQRGRTLALLIHGIMIANAAIGIFEYLSGWRLTPFVIKGEDLAYEWRSTALLGHPLANSILTGSYILTLAVGGGRDLPRWLRLAAFCLSLAAMVTYGGRAASVLVVLMLAALVVRRVLAVLNGAPINVTTVTAALVSVPFAGAGLLTLLSTGFLERFLDRFADDSGSAQTRSDMFEIFSHVPLPDLLFGPDPRLVATWQSLLGLERGVESFWLSFLLSHGLLVSLVIFAALLFFCRDLVRRTCPGAAWVLLYFVGVASLSLSLAGKSNVLTVVTLFVLVLLRASSSNRTSAIAQAVNVR